ncbi:hypothetical protein ALC62_01745 [Cyphomyrmex costatus]|uniref:Uncharacterized protein n=1 Tax=Cyphomyrmex costatus TaxID=456900 RepID=A0A195D3R8_9HYME|nr:hypothetical protein ALC62_01745 [Cyphomyrmex costatus]
MQQYEIACAVRQRKILRPHSLRRDIPSAFCNRRPLENKRCSDATCTAAEAYPRCFKDPGSFHCFLHAFTLFLSSYARHAREWIDPLSPLQPPDVHVALVTPEVNRHIGRDRTTLEHPVYQDTTKRKASTRRAECIRGVRERTTRTPRWGEDNGWRGCEEGERERSKEARGRNGYHNVGPF